MNKLFSKIAALSVGLTLAIGVGVAVGGNTAKGAKADTRTFEKFSGTLVEGDYLIVYDGGAMNTTVTSDRLQYAAVTISDDTIETENASIIWHIAPSGDYWTIYNADADGYAASTGAKNKAQMLDDGTDDKSLWKVTGTSTYEFENKKNKANSVNATLRKNGTYGFACYATSTGGALSLYKETNPGPVVTKYDVTFNPGEGSGTMASQKATEGETYILPECTFTAPQGKEFAGWEVNGTIVTQVEDVHAAIEATATWKKIEAVIDEITLATTGKAAGSNYGNWSNKTASSEAVYAGNSAGGAADNASIQLRSSNSNSGIVTTTSGGKVKKFTLEWNSATASGRTVNFYGKNSAYTQATDLYDTSKQGTLLGSLTIGLSTELSVTGDYTFIGLRSNSGALYLNKISIQWENKEDTGVKLYAEDFSMIYGDPDVAPVVTIKDTTTVVDGCTFESNNESVATVVNGKIHAVGNGTAVITASHVDVGDTKYSSTTFTVTVSKTETIEYLYSLQSGSVQTYGYYAGTFSDGIIIMDGAYGMLVYKAVPEESWEVDATPLHVSGTLTVYNGLYEVKDATVAVETDTTRLSSLNKPVNYSLTGSESTEDLTIANRRTFVSGVLTSIAADSSNKGYNIVVGELSLYLKNADNVEITLKDETVTTIEAYLSDNVNKKVTIKGFTSFFNEFQVRVYDIVEQDDSYTVEQFAQQLLDETDVVCSVWDGKSSNKEALTEIWNHLGGEERWQALSPEEQAKFTDADANYKNESTDVVENAAGRYDMLCKKYFQTSNFANRDYSKAPVQPEMALALFGVEAETDNSMIIIVSIAATTAVAFAALLIIKKKKHN